MQNRRYLKGSKSYSQSYSQRDDCSHSHGLGEMVLVHSANSTAVSKGTLDAGI